MLLRVWPKTLCLFLIALNISPCLAADKNWSGAIDATDWFGEENWYPSSAPAGLDNAIINAKDANVKISETFNAKSITLGGYEASYLTVDEFISGTIAPSSPSDIAILTRKDGHLILKGAGTVVVKGTYKKSEEDLVSQPSLVFSVQ